MQVRKAEVPLLLLLFLSTWHSSLGAPVDNRTSPWPPPFAKFRSGSFQGVGFSFRGSPYSLGAFLPPPPPAVLLPGVIALSPTSRLVIPSQNSPPPGPAFSISVCVFMTEDSTGKIRTIFSKGGNSNQRTPTLALLKNSRRLLFKVTTLFRPEISATSFKQLPLFRWSHVTLTSDGFRMITLFLDGELDGTLYTDSDVILANDGPFAVGKDHVLDGAAMLVSGLKTFGYHLTDAEVKREAQEALENLPRFDILAKREAAFRGDMGANLKPHWKPKGRILEEADFAWRGEVAGSPPAADTPPFGEGLSEGAASGVVELHSDLDSKFAFPDTTKLRTCPTPNPQFWDMVPKAGDSDCTWDGGEETTEEAELQRFWELIHTNAEARTWQPGKRGGEQEGGSLGRPNSDFVEEVALLLIERLSRFTTVRLFLKPLLTTLEILPKIEEQGDTLEDPGEGLTSANGPHKEPVYAGSPEGETAYRTRMAQQQFTTGQVAVKEAMRTEDLDVRLSQLREGFELLRGAAEGGVGLAHLELAYLMAGQTEDVRLGLEDLGTDYMLEARHEMDSMGAASEVGIVENGPDSGALYDGVSGGASETGGIRQGGVLEPGVSGEIDVGGSERAVPNGGAFSEGKIENPIDTPPSQASSHLKAQGAKGERQIGIGASVPSWQQRLTYHFLRAAALGVDEAFHALGYRNLFGLGSPPCNESARFFFEKGAELAVALWQRPGEKVGVERTLLHGGLAQRMQERSNLADLLQLLARRGHRDANVALGNWYLWGAHGMPRDRVRAARHFERAHRAGIPHGTVGLAKMLMSGEGIAQNASKALEYYEDAAEKGDREALNGLGYLAFHGLGGMERNFSKAFEYFKRAADLGSLDGMVNVGSMQRGGLGTPRDDVAAWEKFHLGALEGHVPSCHQAALAASHGYGTERNPGLAAHFFRVVSETGPWAAHLQRGLSAFLDGDHKLSLASYARAAELGYPPAHYNAAWLLEKRFRELGLTRGLGRLAGAVYNEKLVAEGGSDGEGVRGVRADLRAWAHVRLGDCVYYEGGCAGRGGSAESQYRAAGLLGSGQGQFSLAYLLEHGTHGASRNLTEAELFYRLSGEHPNMGAAAAAALAIGKLRAVKVLEAYGVDMGLVLKWLAPLFRRLRTGLELVPEYGNRFYDWARERLFGRVNASDTKGSAGTGVPFPSNDEFSKSEKAGASKVEDLTESEQADGSFASALKALGAASEEWVILGLCVALGFTLGFRWIRQRSRRVASQSGEQT